MLEKYKRFLLALDTNKMTFENKQVLEDMLALIDNLIFELQDMGFLE